MTLPFAPVGLPGRKHANRIGLSVGIDDNEQLCFIAETESDEPLFIASCWILLRESERVFENGDRLSKAHPGERRFASAFRSV